MAAKNTDKSKHDAGLEGGAEARRGHRPDEAIPDPEGESGESAERGVGIVGVCASTGALSAFTELLAGLPPESGLAYVLVPQLAQEEHRPLATCLAEHTAMPIVPVTDGEVPQPNHVYVVPPDGVATLDGNRLRVSAGDDAVTPGAAIDLFLRSLAQTRQHTAIGVLLSGTGSHGCDGLREIKEHGGLTLVQDPATAEHEQMPRNAIEAGCADRVLAPAAMADLLIDYSRHIAAHGTTGSAAPTDADLDQLSAILAQIRARTKYDFRFYRTNMLLRRVRRRMGLVRIAEQSVYLERLRRDPDEVNRLVGDMLIGVTGFFRDAEAFEVLAQRVLDSLIRDDHRSGPLRVWVPGCASGEEAYSIAMLMAEAFERRQRQPQLQIFATDIGERALHRARDGRYPKSIAAAVGPERLRRFFVQAGADHYRVSKQLRESVVFAPQNLITDAPFSKLDLISCRNLLIYLQPEVQRKIIALFHFALRPGAYLLLGPSESIGQKSDMFETVSKRWRLYRRKDEAHFSADGFALPSFPVIPRLTSPLTAVKQPPDQDLSSVAQRLLLEEHGPAAVLINRRYEILYFFGPTSNYLELPAGRPTLDLMSMARQGLRTRLRGACHQALKNNSVVRVTDARVERGGSYAPVEIHVRLMPQQKAGDELLLVSFVERATPTPDDARAGGPASDPPDSAIAHQLEQELKATRDDLQSSIEDLELANEELKASNEEAMSMNEELQSANEELETSKEELQSLNEELSTLNNQLEEKVQELEQSNNDINNLLASTEIATVFLDPQMRIKRFTPGATRLLNLRAGDVGRPLRDLSPNIRDGDLLGDAEHVLERLVPREKEITGEHDTHYLRRILPYRTEDNRIEGVVVTFTDITVKTRAEAANRASEARYRMLFERSPMCLMEQDWSAVKQYLAGPASAAGETPAQWADGHPEQAAESRAHIAVKTINRAALGLLGAESVQEVAASTMRFLPMQPSESFNALLRDLLRGQGSVQEFAVKTADGRDIPVLMHMVPAVGCEESLQRVQVAVIDISVRKTMERHLAERENRLSAILSNVVDGIVSVDRNGVIEEFNAAAERLFLCRAQDAADQPLQRFLRPVSTHGDDDIMAVLLKHLEPGADKSCLCEGLRPGGVTFPIEVSGAEIDHLGIYVLLIRDVSERRELQRQIIETSTQEQQRIGREIHDGLGQELAAAAMMASVLTTKLDKRAQPEASQARELAAQIDRALCESKAIARGLAPVGTGPEDLPDALRELAEQAQRSGDIECVFSKGEDLCIAEPVIASNLYRIAQEALSNAIRHGKPSRITVDLACENGRVRLTVRDNGRWVERRDRGAGGLGLQIMGYRAALLGGTLSVKPLDEGGTLMQCNIPQR
ncbi:MAG: PAS domain-containing protein [Thiohalocapsa sp.]|nr:PAS domain-containing protein [Thiohalocapsa sp.]MCF7990106.1 PAS domain-containing protein [Thiohalocapsa sp.]